MAPWKVCKALQAAVGAADLLWERQCRQIGFWIQRQAWVYAEPPGGGWYKYYCMRMQERYTIRCLMRKYIAFLPAISAHALARGAQPQQISYLEARMGITLPWQVWELYRYRNGQLTTQGAAFAYEGRLLSLEEVAFRYLGALGQNSNGPQPTRHDITREPCLPLTEEFGGRRQYFFNLQGQVFLQTGFQRVRVADSMGAFLQSLLA